jgi:hypothetical protein
MLAILQVWRGLNAVEIGRKSMVRPEWSAGNRFALLRLIASALKIGI